MPHQQPAHRRGPGKCPRVSGNAQERKALLNRGENRGTFRKSEISREEVEEVMRIMSGGEDLQALEAEIDGLLASIAKETESRQADGA